MLLFELPYFLKSANIKNLLINNLSFYLPTAKYFKNTISSGSINAIFTTPSAEKSLVNTLTLLETEYLITKLNEIIKSFNFSENISLFYYDQIFNNNLFKFYNSKSKITHVIYSNDKINPISSNNTLTVDANVIELNQKYFNSILKKELNDSLVFIKIKKQNSNVDIHNLIAILSTNAYILNFDQSNRIITIKLKYPIDLQLTLAKLNNSFNEPILINNRTDDLFNYLK